MAVGAVELIKHVWGTRALSFRDKTGGESMEPKYFCVTRNVVFKLGRVGPFHVAFM